MSFEHWSEGPVGLRLIQDTTTISRYVCYRLKESSNEQNTLLWGVAIAFKRLPKI